MTEPAPVTSGRHASWVELFFDLVVVAAVAQLAHSLHEDGHHGPDALTIVTFFTVYLTIWVLWTTFTLYSNVLAEKVHLRAMFFGMAGIATMAAAVPHAMDGRADLFAAAYLITNGVATSTLQSSGKVLLSWSAASRNSGLLPWIVAFWFDDPWWQLGLWLLGLAITLTTSIVGSQRDEEQQLARYNEVYSERQRRQSRRGRKMPSEFVAAEVDASHLEERLGLFVIIVLGEAMMQLVYAIARIEDWGAGEDGAWLLLIVTALSAFGLLLALWGLNVSYGFAEETRFPPALRLPAHFVAVASITTIAAGLGAIATGFADHLDGATTWLTCGGGAAFLLVINLLVGHTRLWALRGLTVVLPLVAGLLSPWLPSATLLIVTAVAAGGLLWVLRVAKPIPSDS